MADKWFDYSTYMANKRAQLNADDSGTTWTAEQVAEAFENAGFHGVDGAQQHFEQYGSTAAENLSPNSHFVQSQYYIFKAADYFDVDVANVTDEQAAYIAAAIKDAGMSAWSHYTQYGTAEGINPSNDFDTNKYLDAKLAALQAADATTYGSWTRADVAKAFADAGMNALSHAMQYSANDTAGEAAQAFVNGQVIDAYKVDERISGDGETYTLKIGEDDITGTSGDDVFNAPVVEQQGAGGSANTLESVDKLDGGAGTDTLNATVVANAAGAVAPIVKNVENVNVRFAEAQELSLANTTGIENVAVSESAAAGTLSNVGSIANFTVSDQNQGITLDKSSASALNLTFSNVGTNGVVVADLGATAAATGTTLNAVLTGSKVNVDSTVADAFTTVNVTATGSNALTLTDSAATATTVNVAGDGSVDLSGAPLAVATTFDASANNGGVKAEITTTGNVAVTGGAGADEIAVSGVTTGTTSTVALGAGDDTVVVGATIAQFSSVDGGTGTDIINLSHSDDFTAANMAKVKNFETLDITNSDSANAWDLSVKSFNTVQTDSDFATTSGTAFGAAVTLDKVATGFTFTAKATDVNYAMGAAQTIALASDGTSDAVTLANTITDTGDDGTAYGITYTTTTTLTGFETINIKTTLDTKDTEAKASDYVVAFDSIDDDDAKTLNVSGDTAVTIGAGSLDGTVLTKVDAQDLDGGLTIDLSANTTAVQFYGGDGADTYTSTQGDDTIYTAGGADVVNLTAGGSHKVVYKAASDSQIGDSSKDGTITLAADTGFDVVNGFVPGTDNIDLLNFNFSTVQKNVVDVSAKISTTTDLTSVADLFESAAGDRGVALFDDGANTWVFIDANKDGNFTAADDAVVELHGVTGTVTIADFTM